MSPGRRFLPDGTLAQADGGQTGRAPTHPAGEGVPGESGAVRGSGAEVGGAEVGGAEVGGAEVGGAEVGGAEVGGVRDGSSGEEASDRLLDRAHADHGDELYRFCVRALGDRGAAQDCVQEVLLRAWRHAERFDPAAGSLRTWLYAIARHVVIDHRRRTSVRPVVSGVEDAAADRVPTGHRTDELELTVLDGLVVEAALRGLSHEHRTAITRTYLQGRSPTEAAEELGVAPGTVRSRLYYGLRALRGVLTEMGVEL